LNCECQIAPFAFNGATDFDDARDLAPRERRVASFVRQAVLGSVHLDMYPKSVLDIYLLVVNDAGGVESAAVSAASAALVDAGIACKGTVAACQALAIPARLSAGADSSSNRTPAGAAAAGSFDSLHDIVLVDPSFEELGECNGARARAEADAKHEANVASSEARASGTGTEAGAADGARMKENSSKSASHGSGGSEDEDEDEGSAGTTTSISAQRTSMCAASHSLATVAVLSPFGLVTAMDCQGATGAARLAELAESASRGAVAIDGVLRAALARQVDELMRQQSSIGAALSEATRRAEATDGPSGISGQSGGVPGDYGTRGEVGPASGQLTMVT